MGQKQSIATVSEAQAALWCPPEKSLFCGRRCDIVCHNHPVRFRQLMTGVEAEVVEVYEQPLKRAQLGEVGVLTWNVAGVNNNPFEYWVSAEAQMPRYTELMKQVEDILLNPKSWGPESINIDIPVGAIFTEEMWLRLKSHMRELQWKQIDEVEGLWHSDFCERKIISQFLLDKALGKKRLVSMPDRFTNTVRVVPRKPTPCAPQLEPIYRPSVINNYGGDLSSIEGWWEDWQEFMFERRLVIFTPLGPSSRRPCEMLEKIQSSKYPAVTAKEEEISIPLQMLCMAIFDAILVYVMNTIAPDGDWMSVKFVLIDRLYRRKHGRTLELLSSYTNVEVICLQETAATFGEHVMTSGFRETHNLIIPEKMDGKRDQNSILLLSKLVFSEVTEVTEKIMKNFRTPCRTTVANGDVVAVSTRHTPSGSMFCIVSFHADTDGLLTIPFLRAVDAIRQDPESGLGDHKWILSLDANVHEQPNQGQLGLEHLVEWLNEHGITTCWGDAPQNEPCRTTCHSRTFLQSQFQKGIRYEERISKGDRNPKDLILFYKGEFCPAQWPHKDNTGEGYFQESTLLPTLNFPSDHGVVATVLRCM